MTSDSLDLLEFLDQLDADRRAGRELPLSHYLRRFSHIEIDVAREYLASRSIPEAEVAPGGQDADAGGSPRVGPFRLIRELGRGGQGTVHLAEDTRVGRLVALKLLATGVNVLDTAARNRFRREAESIARLEHRYLCSSYEADLDGEQPYIAMRYVQGETLRDRLQRAREAAGLGSLRADRSSTELMLPGRAEIPGIVALIEHAARALHAAHEAGIVHRDIKPGNIQIDVEGRPVILDFGLARFDAAHQGEQITLTAPGQVFGTLAYMAPEQFAGEPRAVDHRCDVYALGVTLYESLTLTLPFSPDELVGRDPALRPTPRSPQAHNDAIGDELRVVIETAMAVEPRRRYQTALSLAEDLRRIREFEPILARRAGAWLRLRRWARRNRRLVITASGVLVLLLLGAWAWLDSMAERLRRATHELDANRATDLVETDPPFALLWAREAAKTGQDEKVNTAAMSALANYQRVWTASRPVGRVGYYTPCFAVGGDRVGTITDDHAVVIKNLVTGEAEATTRQDAENSSLSAAADGSEFFATWRNGAVSRWGADTGFRAFRCAAPGLDGKQVLSVSTVPGHAEWLLFVTRQHDVVLWDRQTARELFHVQHALAADEHLTAVLAKDGSRLVTAPSRPFDSGAKLSTGGAARVWAVPSGSLEFEVGDRGHRLNWLEFSADGHHLVLAYDDGHVGIHDVDTHAATGSHTYASEVFMARFHPDNARIVVCVALTRPEQLGLKQAPIRVLDLRGHELQALEGHQYQGVQALTFSHDGRWLVSAGNDNRLCVRSAVDLPRLEERAIGRLWTRPARVQWSDDDRYLVTCEIDGVADCWSTQQASVRTLLHPCPVTAVCFSPRSDLVVTGCADGSLRIWNRAAGTLIRDLPRCDAGVRAVQFSGDGAVMMADAPEPRVRLFDTSDWDDATSVPVPASVSVAVLARDGTSAAVGDSEGHVTLVDLRDKMSRCIGKHAARVECAAFAADGESLVTGGGDRTAMLWDLRDPAGPRCRSRCDPFAATDLAMLTRIRAACELPPGEGWLILTDQAQMYRWDPAQERTEAVPRSSMVNRISLHPRGDLLALTRSGSVVVWSWPGRIQRADDIAFMGPVSALSFGAGGRYLLSASYDGSAHLVRTDGTPRPWAIMRGHQKQILAAALSRDERWVATASNDGTVRIWPTEPLAHIDELGLPAVERPLLERLSKASGR